MLTTEVIEYVKSIYIDDPAGTQPTALWKVFEMYEDVDYEIEFDKNNIRHLQICSNDILISYFSRYGRLSLNDLKCYPLALVNSKYIDMNPVSIECDKFFKKLFRFDDNFKHFSNESIQIEKVNIHDEIQDVVFFINRCYTDIHVSVDEVNKWSKSNVFEENLWIWIVDDVTGAKIALGIAEVDRAIGEGVLEWIQVDPEYQGKGYGKLLVNELQYRMRNYVAFITVSGKIDGNYNPAKLYESCGFRGQDIWLIIRNNR